MLSPRSSTAMSTTASNYAAIWDVDGTLVDTAGLHFAAWCQFAAEINRPFTRHDFAATFGQRNPEIIRALFDPNASDERCREWGERKEIHYRQAAAAQGIQLLPGVAELLTQLSDHGWRQALGSSAPRKNLELLVQLTNIERFISAIVCGDDVQRGKPDPEVFLLAANRLGIPSDRCVVLEDAVAGVEAAKAAQMACVAVAFVGHHPAEKLRKAGADLIVKSLAEVDAAQLVPLVSR